MGKAAVIDPVHGAIQVIPRAALVDTVCVLVGVVPDGLGHADVDPVGQAQEQRPREVQLPCVHGEKRPDAAVE